jgi:hypothetical protein
MLRQRDRITRRGATLVETAIVITLFLTLVLGMIDLGMGVFLQHMVSEAARQGVRQSIVHGSLAPSGWNGGAWDPTQSIDVVATDTGVPIVASLRNGPLGELEDPGFLTGLDLGETRIQVTWPDATNSTESRMRVTVSAPYRPMMTFIFGNPTITLSATATMPIAH